ncbi:amino acid transport protein [Lactobacillus selangorensis]|uniref:Amino acid transport protein n=1 Tax=Lactobacillus selangorensis TaxID=81857 RepID=A0A0R2FUL0_9LACO|nr:amino acid permease [Lactobacillus selangorensis]KRN28509.1 amino acid transport protein [Lactobacillus selangorensis]KRN32009.1 amino acid transport protein [Lactobacillus selangorensis]
MDSIDSQKKLRWYNIALISFVSVWGLGNVVNNYANEGLPVVTSWILIIALYFVPYVMIVGQLGSTFKDAGGGVSSWVKSTSTKRLAYFAAWTYWVVHVPYLAQKPQNILIALSWVFKGNGNFINTVSSLTVSIICLVIFLFFLWVASTGVATLNRIGSIAGTAMFIMSLLFILLAVSAPAMTGAKIATPNMTNIKSYIPHFNFQYLTTLSMLVFAVGGAEKISPYVNKTKNSSKEFPMGMLILAGMVAVCAILGSFAMGILFDSHHIPSDLMANGAYDAFQRLGNYYHVGNVFMILYAIANAMASISALAISIDAPLQILLSDADPKYVPKALAKKNKKGTPVNGYIMTGILVSLLIIVPSLGIGNMNELYNWLLNLNSVVMPLRYLWVFFAFMMLNRQSKKFTSDYKFIKNPHGGYLIGLWCFVFTAFACIMGMVPKTNMAANPSAWWFQLALNIIMPIFLIVLGLILPAIAKRTNKAND